MLLSLFLFNLVSVDKQRGQMLAWWLGSSPVSLWPEPVSVHASKSNLGFGKSDLTLNFRSLWPDATGILAFVHRNKTGRQEGEELSR